MFREENRFERSGHVGVDLLGYVGFGWVGTVLLSLRMRDGLVEALVPVGKPESARARKVGYIVHLIYVRKDLVVEDVSSR